jgi:hypothetical protein
MVEEVVVVLELDAVRIGEPIITPGPPAEVIAARAAVTPACAVG